MKTFDYIYFVMIAGLLSAFILLLMRKWGVIEWLQVHGSRLVAEMANCNFCLSWWANVIVCLVLAAVMQNPFILLVPFCSTPATRMLI